ncbi:MAG: type II secretion system F family protein [Planctomycetia bacterium]|nr:type II secretion system F family protein [Planctomycetia bacterium]
MTTPIFAAVDLQAMLPSAAIGLSLFFAAWWVLRALVTEDIPQGAEWRHDTNRINELRRVNLSYRLFQPLIQALARLNRGAFREQLPEIQRDISTAGIPRFWLAEEYLARAELIAVMLAPVYIYAAIHLMGMTGIVFALIGVMLTVWLLRNRLRRQARNRLLQIKRRMPFLLDLLTLLMEAGSNFLQAMAQSVREFEGHPVSVEFGRVLSDMNLGKTRTEAFRAMQDRLNDDEITSIIGSILQGEDLGTPLAQIFRTQADVLRLKRTQRAETLAAEAGVNMLLPGILIMLSTVLIILGPFVISFGFSGLLF